MLVDLDASPVPDQLLHAVRLRAGRLSLGVGILVLAGKLLAALLTASTAALSDAMESVVNVVAAAVLLLSLRIAARPADRDHPYGHGKVEFFSAGIEGGFLLGAAAWIIVEAIDAMVVGRAVHSFDLGVLCLAVFGALNAALGVYLVRVGRRTHSIAIVADGRHVLTDVWTTGAVIVGLAAVWLTGWSLLDPLVALAVALHVAAQGIVLIRAAVRGLMDEADTQLLSAVLDALEARRQPAWIDVHGLRGRRAGVAVHTDFHLVVPRYYDVDQLHDLHDEVEAALAAVHGDHGETVVHFDPCRPRDCHRCDVPHCPARRAELEARYSWTMERVTRADAVVEAARAAVAPPA